MKYCRNKSLLGLLDAKGKVEVLAPPCVAKWTCNFISFCSVFLLKLGIQALAPPCASEVIVSPNHCKPSPAITSPCTDNFQDPIWKPILAHSYSPRILFQKLADAQRRARPESSSPQVWNEINQSSLPLFGLRGCGNPGYKAGYSLSHMHFSSAPNWISAVFS